MPAEESLGLGSIGGVGAALLMLGSGTNVYDAYSAVMSSPWSTEKFTQSPEEEEMAMRYVKHAITIAWIYAGISAALAYSTDPRLAIWPLLGATVATIYMYWLYKQAIENAHGLRGRT